jgi:hypothetical protein
MTSIIYNKIIVIYIIKLIRKLNFTNGLSYNAVSIHKKIIELDIKPCPSLKNIRDILKLCGNVNDYIY